MEGLFQSIKLTIAGCYDEVRAKVLNSFETSCPGSILSFHEVSFAKKRGGIFSPD